MLFISPLALADGVTPEEEANKNTLNLCTLHQEFDSEADEDGDRLKFLLDIADLAQTESYGEANCGTINPGTGFVEKGDCTAEGKVITEISEVFGPDIEEDSEGNEITTVYKGVCCLITDSTGGQCLESRSIYTKDFNSCKDNASFCERRQWIIGTSGIGIVKIYVKQLYIYGAGVIGFISVVTMVISGIQIQVSGVSGDITSAKERIFKALGGLVLLFMSGLILYTINPTFFS